MNWSFVLLAQHEDPEVGSVLQQIIIRPLASEKRFEKIRNAEMGKFLSKEKCGQNNFIRRFLSGH